jgi:hypothetical protein
VARILRLNFVESHRKAVTIKLFQIEKKFESATTAKVNLYTIAKDKKSIFPQYKYRNRMFKVIKITFKCL